MKEEKLFLILYLSSKYNLPTGPIIDPVTRVELVGERLPSLWPLRSLRRILLLFPLRFVSERPPA